MPGGREIVKSINGDSGEKSGSVSGLARVWPGRSRDRLEQRGLRPERRSTHTKARSHEGGRCFGEPDVRGWAVVPGIFVGSARWHVLQWRVFYGASGAMIL